MFHLTGFSKNYCCSMFLKQSKLSFSFVSVLPKRNCFEMLNRAYIFTSGALPPRKKNHDERIKRSVLIWGAQAPYRQKPSILKKTHDERIERTTQKWSAQATHRQTLMIWNSVAACKELQQKWCYSLLWRDNVENVVTRCCNFS